jgi:glycosyltransferase involved in cell wall biosynthesis
MMLRKPPKLSVCVITHNQEKYIRQCLQTILDQVTNFDFEVIISDDCSTDNTRIIVQEFAERYQSKVKLIFHERNIGASKNFVFVHQQALGEYIAHVDGDDYCLPGKLQAQVDLLDQDPDCNIVWHKMLLEISGETYEGSLHLASNIGKLRLDRSALIQYMSLAGNSSKMYRKKVGIFDIPDFEVIDYFANVEQVGSGFGRILDSAYYGVYRMGVGIASSNNKTQELLVKSFIYFYEKYPENRLQVNTAVLVCLLADIKNQRQTWKMFFQVWIKTFHIGSIFNLIRSLSFLKNTTLPKRLIKANPSASAF